jgi:GxxExxY protein
MTTQDYNRITSKIIKCAMEVHKHLGPGLLESVYDFCLFHEIQKTGLRVERQKLVPIMYNGMLLEKDFFIDQLVEDEVILELKSMEGILPIHEAQLLTYLKLSDKKLGLLINFNVPVLKDGIRRKINGTL